MERAFWLVWRTNGAAPMHRHDTERSATLEAERLARVNPGCRFVIMQAVGAREVETMRCIEYDPSVPF